MRLVASYWVGSILNQTPHESFKNLIGIITTASIIFFINFCQELSLQTSFNIIHQYPRNSPLGNSWNTNNRCRIRRNAMYARPYWNYSAGKLLVYWNLGSYRRNGNWLKFSCSMFRYWLNNNWIQFILCSK